MKCSTAFAAEHVRGNPKARQQWAAGQMLLAAKASKNLGLTDHATFSGCARLALLLSLATAALLAWSRLHSMSLPNAGSQY